MRTLIVRDAMRIPIGRQGENEAQRVVWPDIVTGWAKLYGDGVFSLAVKRKGDAAPYPVTVTTEDGALVWVPTNADTAVAGSGSCELSYTVDDVLAKSQMWSTEVYSSLTGEGETEPPEPYQSWVDAVLKAGAAAETAAQDAANSAGAAAAWAEASQSAQTGAETAQTAAEDAQEAAESARDAAAASSTSAAGSAASAAQSAQAASSAQGAAEAAKTDAQTAASAAARSATNAATSESNAFTYQQGAKEYRDETEKMLDDLVKYDNDEFASTLPFNADRLNGHPDSYFAKQEDMSAAEQGIADNRSDILSLRSVAERLGITKVDKETGKGLSANDYSNEEKQKVAENAAARHTHANKSVLDQITQAMLDLIGTIAGKYVKPNGGIPKSDLASDVQTSLAKADSALQQHQSLAAYRTASAQDTLDAQKYSATNPPPYPVTSVNGQTGGVVLNYITFDEEES